MCPRSPESQPMSRGWKLSTTITKTADNQNGFNLYPVSALHWAQVYYERGDYNAMLEILDELLPFATHSTYNDTEYAVSTFTYTYRTRASRGFRLRPGHDSRALCTGIQPH
ncbi:hypothetical protein [Thermococcus piezophilus]|uniref:hypothetical protein n=1 Tax=Thermococcus piezophilus TaxID=1712654 RepID=UPI0019008BEF|nr:hypothetical protein [Thermococcus piezophilus]